MPGMAKADGEQAEPVNRTTGIAVGVLLVGSVVAAAWAANDFILHSVLLAEALLRRLFF